MNYKIGNVSFDPEAVLKLGKTKFVTLHPHIEDAEGVYDAIEAAHGKGAKGAKAEKSKSE